MEAFYMSFHRLTSGKNAPCSCRLSGTAERAKECVFLRDAVLCDCLVTNVEECTILLALAIWQLLCTVCCCKDALSLYATGF